jgi:molybdopterin converting factor subunit 1
MIVHVRLFARARDLAGSDAVRVQLPEGATVADLRRRLAADCPTLAPLLERSALAVANEFAEDALVLSANAEVALLPPVSGGSTDGVGCQLFFRPC